MKAGLPAKTILITGVSTGIGFDAARYLIGKGYFVFGSVRDNAAKARLENTFSAENFRALLFDVTDQAAIAAAAREVETALDGNYLTALFNNAGLAVGGPLQLLEDDRFRHQIEVCLFGVRNTTNAFLPQLGAHPSRNRAAGDRSANAPGKIINMSSLSGILNTPMNGAYCVAKHALESLGEVYRRELIQYGIDVVSIRSGPIASCIWDKNIDVMAAYAGTDYRTMAASSRRIMIAAQKDAFPAETISKLVHKIIESRRPKCAYIVNKNKWIPTLLANYLPARFVDRLIWRSLNARNTNVYCN